MPFPLMITVSVAARIFKIMPADIQSLANWNPILYQLSTKLLPIDCQSYATWVYQYNFSLKLTRCSFGCVYWKKAVSNSTQRSSYIHSQKNPVSKCCLIVLGYVCQLTSNLMPLEWYSFANWHPIQYQSTANLMPLEWYSCANWHPIQNQSTANGMSLDCQWSVTWLPI